MRFELPAEKKLVYECVVPLRWGDMDAMGHVNNTLYFRYMEIARLDWLAQVGAGTDAADEGPVIVNAFCNFRRQLAYPGELRVLLFVANPGRSSFDTFHTLERTDLPGVLWADGGARVVWTDYRRRQSAPMPDWLRALLA
ncbi:MAG: acyl-CoA thioesterase [Burkholderiales bacterium]|nr:acyl-CoA thioesterase [Burkholderiales bacterium]MDE2277691.1 acyl-CoA thioesterase [Burkholderiales bacterium]